MEAKSAPKKAKRKASQTQTSSPRKTRNACPKPDRTAEHGKRRGHAERIIAQIRELQQRECESNTTLIYCRIEIGLRLLALQEQIGHGGWTKTLVTLGYSERQAQRLMQIAKCPWADEIRTSGTDFVLGLPSDLQKLASLAKLTREQLQDLMAREDLNELSRGAVSAHVDQLFGGFEEFDSEWKPTSANVDPTEDMDIEETTVATDESDNIPGPAAQTVAPNRDANAKVASQGMDQQHRVQLYRRLVMGGATAGHRAVKIAVERAFPPFKADVLGIARQHGKVALNEAVRLEKCDGETLAMLLLHRLREDLQPEQAFNEEAANPPESNS